MLKKGRFFVGALILTLGALMMLASCNLDKKTENKPNKPNNPSTPDEPSVNYTPKSLIDRITVLSKGNDFKLVTYKGQAINVSGKTDMEVALKKGTNPEDAKITAKLGDEIIDFSDFEIGYSGAVFTRLEDLKGVTAEAKEMKIKVTVGSFYDEWNFQIKEFDESNLVADLNLTSFKIADTEVKDKVVNQTPTYRLSDPGKENIKVAYVAAFSKDLTAATMIVDGKPMPIELGVDKKQVETEVEFEKNSTKVFSFIFQADGSKDVNVGPFTIIFTNTVWPEVFVEAGVRPEKVEDIDLMSGNVLEYNDCTITEPKIMLKTYKKGKAGIIGAGKITKVTVDDVDVAIVTNNAGEDTEEYVATWTCNPALATAGQSKTVKVHVEGVGFDNSGAQVAKDSWDFSVKFTLVQFIEAQLFVKADGNDFEELRGDKRVYDQNVIIKLVTLGDELKDVLFKDYKDADGKTPDFDLNGKEATASVKLVDTEFKPSKLKIVAKVEGKSDTTFEALLRYTAKDDPISIGGNTFGIGDIEKKPDPSGAVRMTGERAKLYILVGQNTERLTSIKINGTEMMDKTAYTDPLQIIESAKGVKNQGQFGTSLNAVIVIGKDDMKLDHNYELIISLAGETKGGHRLSEVTLPPLKIRLPDYGDSNAEWRVISSDGKMDLLLVNEVYHKDDKAKLYYNYYGIESFTAAVFTKNPKAKVEGFWYKADQMNAEMLKIINDKNHPNWIKFKPVETIYGESKWGFDMNFNSAEMQGNAIGLFLYVVAKDGTKMLFTEPGSGKVTSPYWQQFRTLKLQCSFTKLDNNTGFNDGWDKMSFADTLEIKESDWTTKVQGNKLYFRAVTFAWEAGMKYHLFTETGTGQLTSPIKEFENLNNLGKSHDNRFTVDVSSITAQDQSLEVEIPVYLDGVERGTSTPFKAQIFTRKFTIKRVAD